MILFHAVAGGVGLGIFAQKGSLFFTRPTLFTYAAERADMVAMADDLFRSRALGKGEDPDQPDLSAEGRR